MVKSPAKSPFNSACKEVADFCNNYLRVVDNASTKGQILTKGKIDHPSYPTMLLAYQWSHGYAFELLGATDRFTKLEVIKRRVKSINDILGNFEAQNMHYIMDVEDGIADAGLANLRLNCVRDMASFVKRYPGMKDLHKTVFNYDNANLTEAGAFNALRPPHHISSFFLRDILSVNSFRNTVRMRYFQTLIIVDKQTNITNILYKLFPIKERVDLIVPATKQHREQLNRAASFASLTATKSPETTIGRFLEQNQDILLSALNAQKLIPIIKRMFAILNYRCSTSIPLQRVAGVVGGLSTALPKESRN